MSQPSPAAHPADPFKPAVREALKLRLALYGPSKSGKTLDALLIARGVVGPEGRIAVIDSENRSSLIYSDEVPGGYNVRGIEPPYAPSRFAQGINIAVQHGYDIVILDGISPAWNGAGGVQEIVDANMKGENRFSGWAVGSPAHQTLVQAILACPVHIICTMRSTTDWFVDGQGRPKKVGLKPVQREGIDYEFTIVGDISPDHRIDLEARGKFEGRVLGTADDWKQELIAFGAEAAEWLGSGAAPPAPAPAPAAPSPAAAPQPGGFNVPPAPTPNGPAADGALVEEIARGVDEWVGKFKAINDTVDWPTTLAEWSQQTYGHQPIELTREQWDAFQEKLEVTVLSMQQPASA